MDLDDLARLGDENLAAAWAALGRACGGPVEVADSLTLTATGLPIAFFNGAFLARRSADPSSAVRDALAFFDRQGVPFLMWVRDGVDDDLLAEGRGAGLRDAGRPPAMGLPVIPEPPCPLAGLELSVASTAEDVQAHRNVLTAGFGFTPDVAQQIIGDALLDHPDVAIIVGRVDGQPVTTGLLMQTGQTAGVYNIATVAAHRGNRYGEAVTWAVIAEGARRGCTQSILQSSPMGYPLYQRMGFVDLGSYLQLEGPAAR